MNKIEKALLLLADNEECDRRVCVKTLSPLFAEIIEVVNGKDALRCLENQNFDCIILDHLLPDYDGLNLVKTIRAKDTRTPIVVITGHGDERLAVEILKAGAQDYIPKDQLENLLLLSVTSAIESSKLMRETEYYKNFYNNAAVGFTTTTLDEGKFIKANNAFIKFLGYKSFEDLCNATTIDLHYGNGRKKLVDNLLMGGGSLINYEIPLKTKSGQTKWLSLSGKLCKGTCKTEGKCLPDCTGARCIDCTLVDISEKKQLEVEIENLKKEQFEILQDTQRAIEERLKCYDGFLT